MTRHEVELKAGRGIFEGLSKQNMLFHECIGELVDNSIAAKPDDKKFQINISFINNGDSEKTVDVYIADNSEGMNLETFKKALQPGESATKKSRLNEHGFGLKNALATLSKNTGEWQIWTSHQNEEKIYTVKSPFESNMYIDECESFPDINVLQSDISTLVRVRVKLKFIQTIQGRGAPATDLNTLRTWLIEHLGVMYRGFLEQDPHTAQTDGVISVSIKQKSISTVSVSPIQVPLGNKNVEYLDVELDGDVHKLEYHYGTLDEVKRDQLVKGDSAKFYYQGNQSTQGIDIRLGKRVIATRQLGTIWENESKKTPLSRHNSLNDFVGELIIPELPRGVLTTVNNKTDFNLDDPDWEKIFKKLNKIKPEGKIRQKTEKKLKKEWMKMINATNPDEKISDEISVWPTGTKIDVHRETNDGQIIIYEIKVGTGSPIDLYQLKMYWDGLVIQEEQPNEGILIVEDFNTNLEKMANQMNELTPPKNSEAYNFKISRHEDLELTTK